MPRKRCKPVRRALFETDKHTNRRRNLQCVENLLTISVEEFKNKWNFDPIKMKPSNENVIENDKINKDDDIIQPRFQWKLINNVDDKDKKELENTVCSLPTNSVIRRSLLFTSPSVNSPVITQDNSISSSESNTSTESLSLSCIENDVSSPSGKPLEIVTSNNSEHNEEQKSINIDDSEKNNNIPTVAIDPTTNPTTNPILADVSQSAVPTVASQNTNNISADSTTTKQLKITGKLLKN